MIWCVVEALQDTERISTSKMTIQRLMSDEMNISVYSINFSCIDADKNWETLRENLVSRQRHN
jgi:hypothetical protein